MYIYAQLAEDNVCIGVSQLAGEVSAPHMVRLTEEELVLGNWLGRKYVDGAWEAEEEENA